MMTWEVGSGDHRDRRPVPPTALATAHGHRLPPTAPPTDTDMTAAHRVPFSSSRRVRIAGFAHAVRNLLRFAGVPGWHLIATAPARAEDPEFTACPPLYRNCAGRQLGDLQTSQYLETHAARISRAPSGLRGNTAG